MISFLDLQTINLKYNNQFKEAFERVTSSGCYVNGPELQEFEKEFANYCGTKYSIGVGNGLDALSISLKVWKIQGKIKDGDEVIVPSNTFIASILSIIQSGLIPILIDHDINSHNIDPLKIINAISEKTKVIMPVHLYGKIADMESITKVAKENNLLVLEDAAQGHGSVLKNKKAGAWGDAAAFSFYPGKNLGALGDAGAITTQDEDFYNTAKAFSNYGSNKKYLYDYLGVNSRLDELQASFLRVKLKDLDNEIKIRRDLAETYFEKITNENLSLPFYDEKLSHVFHLFVIRARDRNKLQNYLKEKNVETLIHYPKKIFEQKSMQTASYKDLSSFSICDEILSIPIGSHLTRENIKYVAEKLNKF